MADQPNLPARDPDAWLQAQADRLLTETERIEALSHEEVLAELTEEDPDAQAILTRLQDQALALQAQAEAARHAERNADTGLVPTEPPPSRTISRPSPWRFVVPMALLLVVGGMGLWALSQPPLPTTAALVDVQATRALFASARGVPPDALVASLEALPTEPSTTFGFFPHYDDDALAEATSMLEAAYASLQRPEGDPEPPTQKVYRALSAYLLAQAALLDGNVSVAREWLLRAQSEAAPPWTQEATRLLAELEALEDAGGV
ncbi:MAG: hypothetical protein AAF624_12760 [Bacteroidota bacterium]